MDQKTQEFLLHVFGILGFSNREVALQNFISTMLQQAVRYAYNLVGKEKQTAFVQETKDGKTIESLDSILRAYLPAQSYAQLLLQSSQYAFQDVLTQRGRSLTDEEKTKIASLTNPFINQQMASLRATQPALRRR